MSTSLITKNRLEQVPKAHVWPEHVLEVNVAFRTLNKRSLILKNFIPQNFKIFNHQTSSIFFMFPSSTFSFCLLTCSNKKSLKRRSPLVLINISTDNEFRVSRHLLINASLISLNKNNVNILIKIYRNMKLTLS